MEIVGRKIGTMEVRAVSRRTSLDGSCPPRLDRGNDRVKKETNASLSPSASRRAWPAYAGALVVIRVPDRNA